MKINLQSNGKHIIQLTAETDLESAFLKAVGKAAENKGNIVECTYTIPADGLINFELWTEK